MSPVCRETKFPSSVLFCLAPSIRKCVFQKPSQISFNSMWLHLIGLYWRQDRASKNSFSCTGQFWESGLFCFHNMTSFRLLGIKRTHWDWGSWNLCKLAHPENASFYLFKQNFRKQKNNCFMVILYILDIGGG